MTESQSGPQRRNRLGIIHLLGWMAACGVAITILRDTSDLSEVTRERLVFQRLTQAMVAIGYGTALAGLSLLVYRRVRQGTKFPSQPGHWLFLLGTLGLLVEGAVRVVAQLAARWWSQSHTLPFPEYWFLQTLGWTLGALMGIVALFFIARSQPRRWVALAVCVWLAVTTNAITHSLPLAQQLSGWSITWLVGTWPYFYAGLLRFCGDLLCLVMLTAGVAIELRTRVRRDWLHWGGVLAGTILAVVDAANHGTHLALTKW